MRSSRINAATPLRARKCMTVFLLLLVSAVLMSAPGVPFRKTDKAYYADSNLVNFVRPGLVIDIVSAQIEGDGTIRARFKLTDPRVVS